MRDRLIVCKYYTYENGPCSKRDVNVQHKVDCKNCKLYDPRPGVNQVREKSKREKLERAARRERDE